MPTLKLIVGVDFGSHSVKAAWLSLRSGSLQVERIEHLALPSGSTDASRLIRPWVERHGLDRMPCALSLPGAQTVFQPGRLAPDDPRKPEQAASMEVATFNDLAGDQMLHDVTAFEWRPGTRQYLISMARPSFINRAIETAVGYGVRPADLIPAPLAVFGWYERLARKSEGPRLYVHMGHTQTEMAIGRQGGLLFARSTAMGGRAFTDAIAQARGVASAQAETLKVSEAALDDQNAFAEILRPSAERWAAQIASGIAVYRSQFSDRAFLLSEVVLCGGGARLRGLAELLGARLDLPVVSSDSLTDAADGGRIDAHNADLACGLAAVALEATPARLSLLPERLRDEVVFRAKKPYWVAAGVLAALSLGVITISGLRGIERELRTLATEEAALQQRENTADLIERAKRQDKLVRDTAGPLADLLLSGPLARELITLVARSIRDSNDWISMISDEHAYLSPEPQPEQRPARRPLPGMRGIGAPATQRQAADRTSLPPPMRGFIVEGYTPDPSMVSVQRLIARLTENQLVAKADLIGDDLVRHSDWFEGDPPPTLTNLTHFVIRVEVSAP